MGVVLIDSRVGSKDLAEPLRKLGLEVEVTTLDFADVAFEGRGEHNAPVDIGIELKIVPDLISSLRSGRLSGHQLPGLTGPKSVYEYAWLLIEGQWRADRHGMLIKWKREDGWKKLHGSMRLGELQKTLLTLELQGGLHVHRSDRRVGTLRFITSLYHWFTDKALDQHRSHLAIHTPHSFIPISPFRQVVAQLPGVGIKTSRAVEQCFEGSLTRAVNASVEEWAGVTTKDEKGRERRLGMKVAERIVKFCAGEVS